MTDMGQFGEIMHGSPTDAGSRRYGVAVGLVTNNQDPDKLGRVKVKFPWLSDEHESHWARVITPMAGKSRGLYFIPEVDDEVLVAFEHGDMRFACVLGSLWNGKDTPPEDLDAENTKRSITSRSGHVIRLDDTDGSEKIEILDKSSKNTIVIDTAANTVTILADADITIKSSSGKLVFSGNGVEIKSQADVTIEAGTGLELKAGAGLKLQAGANADLKASGPVSVKGAMVNLN